MTSRRPDLVALDLLTRVAETGSLGRAAAQLDMAQPNASRAIARLERQLDVSLVIRTTSGSRLTPEGAVVVEWAREALVAVDRLVVGARSLAAQHQAQLAVAASLTIAEYLAPAWLGRFRRSHPDVRITLAVDNSEGVVEQVVAGQVALGFVESPSVPRSVASTTVAHDRLAVVVGAHHPWARRARPVGPAELADADLLLREAGSGTRQTLERALVRAGTKLGAAHLELASTAAVKAAAAEGGGPAVLSLLAVASDLADGSLVEVPVDGLDLRRRLRAVWLPPRRPSGLAAELVRIAAAPTALPSR